MNSFHPLYVLLLSIIFQSIGGIFGKLAAESITILSIQGIFTNLFFILSLGCLALQAIVWQQALRYFPLSIAYPCISITNFVVLFSASIIFNETITNANIIGLIVITLGIWMLFNLQENSI